MITLEEWKEKIANNNGNEFHYWFAPSVSCCCNMSGDYDDDRYVVGQVYEGYSKNGGYVIDSCGEEELFDFYEDAFFPARDCYWSKKEAKREAHGKLMRYWNNAAAMATDVVYTLEDEEE